MFWYAARPAGPQSVRNCRTWSPEVKNRMSGGGCPHATVTVGIANGNDDAKNTTAEVRNSAPVVTRTFQLASLRMRDDTAVRTFTGYLHELGCRVNSIHVMNVVDKGFRWKKVRGP